MVLQAPICFFFLNLHTHKQYFSWVARFSLYHRDEELLGREETVGGLGLSVASVLQVEFS